MLDGEIKQWTDIDIGCGGGGGGCSSSFGYISGGSTGLMPYYIDGALSETGRYVPSGCEEALIFSGCGGINIEISGAGLPPL